MQGLGSRWGLRMGGEGSCVGALGDEGLGVDILPCARTARRIRLWLHPPGSKARPHQNSSARNTHLHTPEQHPAHAAPTPSPCRPS